MNCLNITALASCLLVCGCGSTGQLDANVQREWYAGKWVLDKEMTVSEAGPSIEKLGPLHAQLLENLLASVEGRTLAITSDELQNVDARGNGQTTEIEIIENTAEKLVIKATESGEITTWGRQDPWLIMNTTGDLDLKIYFRRSN